MCHNRIAVGRCHNLVSVYGRPLNIIAIKKSSQRFVQHKPRCGRAVLPRCQIGLTIEVIYLLIYS
ncbi:hypothetical protein E2C01_070120 [Portunus trituberculatus]|uniref:Uncharacterized protein n=1 Tax=Portunus trituberculatus TaxID=210409 RepID=A0A5B7I1A1_PORTR|nr:hypothetical protein [Portunus trituberculatus]